MTKEELELLIVEKSEECENSKPKYFKLKYFTTMFLKNLILIILSVFMYFYSSTVESMAGSIFLLKGVMALVFGGVIIICVDMGVYHKPFYFDLFKINTYMKDMIYIQGLKTLLKKYKIVEEEIKKIDIKI